MRTLVKVRPVDPHTLLPGPTGRMTKGGGPSVLSQAPWLFSRGGLRMDA